MLTIAGMGTGRMETLTLGVYRQMKNAQRLVLQTGQVPIAASLREEGLDFETLDPFYETAEDFDSLADAAAAFVLQEPDTLFCVLGDVAGNALVQKILEHTTEVELFAGLSLAEEALTKGAQFLKGTGVRTIAAADLASLRPETNVSLVIYEVDNPYVAADVSDWLLRYYPDQLEIGVLKQGNFLKCPLRELARLSGFAYDTAIVVPAMPLLEKETYSLWDLVDILAILRGEGGCPWDREQTHASLKPYLLEESYEVMAAVDQEDPMQLADELGDVLMQVAFHAQIGEECGEFDLTDITTCIAKKMIHRHTHIFGGDKLDTSSQVAANWEKIKRQEKGLATITDSLKDVPLGMELLLRAAKVQKKAAGVGFDWPDYRGALEKVQEELLELQEEIEKEGALEEEAGDLLFACVNLLRLLKVNGAVALEAAIRKFISRFQYMEKKAEENGNNLASLSLDEQEKLWQQAKQVNLLKKA